MNRRSFFKFLPVAPLALVTEGARAVSADGQPDASVHLQLNAYKKIENRPGVFNIRQPDVTRSVFMSVGQDGNLWLKTAKSEWKKVVTE